MSFDRRRRSGNCILIRIDQKRTRTRFYPLPIHPFGAVRISLARTRSPRRTLLDTVTRARVASTIIHYLCALQPSRMRNLSTSTLRTTLTPTRACALRTTLGAPTDQSHLPRLNASDDLSPLITLRTCLTGHASLTPLSRTVLTTTTRLLARSSRSSSLPDSLRSA